MAIPPRQNRLLYKGTLVGCLLIVCWVFLNGCTAPPTQSQAEAYVSRAFADLRTGDTAAAMIAIEKALALDPTLARAYYIRAQVYRAGKAYTAALADLHWVIAHDPDNLDAYGALGITYQAVGDLEKTVANYQKALALDPENANWYNNLCWAYGVFNQPEAGLEYCEQAVERQAAPYIHDSRGLVYALLGDYGNAIIDFTIFVNYYEKTYRGRSFPEVEQRKAWIKTMQAGENPFTEAVLEALRTE